MSVKIRKCVFDQHGHVVEEYEGTEEEIAAYESKKNKRAQTEQAKKQRTVLHGKDLEDIKRIVEDAVKATPAPIVVNPLPAYPYPPSYRWLVRCKWCGAYGCQAVHIDVNNPTLSGGSYTMDCNTVVAATGTASAWNGLSDTVNGIYLSAKN